MKERRAMFLVIVLRFSDFVRTGLNAKLKDRSKIHKSTEYIYKEKKQKIKLWYLQFEFIASREFSNIIFPAIKTVALALYPIRINSRELYALGLDLHYL